MTNLVKFEAARQALAEAAKVEDVKKIHDWAKVFMDYAQQAKDVELLLRAVDVRLEAERKAGQLLIAMAKRGEREVRGGDRKSKLREITLKLGDLDISKKESMHWQRRAALSDEAFALLVKSVKQEAIAIVAMTASEKMAVKRERRLEREQELGAKIRALPQKRFGVLYADPPWRFETWSEKGMDRAADNHYPTMSLEEIQALDVPAAKDCVLFLWATSPMLPRGLEVMAAWGFDYKTCNTWIKGRLSTKGVLSIEGRRGTGHWFFNVTDLLLVGTRGKVPAPAPGEQWPSVIVGEPRGKHSAKPAIFYELIEEMFPSLPKVELFARQKRAGWDGWGQEAPD
jgi:N6-adenosine-specific RNA methylase IME4